jgi:hypothetical protein
LSGTFTTVSAAAPFSFAVTVTDALGAIGTVKAVFSVFAHIAFTVSTATCAATLTPLTCTNSQLQYTGGTPGGTPSVKVTGVKSATNQLPAGFTAVAKGGTIFVNVPSQKANYSGTVTLVLVDQSLCGAGTTCQSGTATLTIRV